LTHLRCKKKKDSMESFFFAGTLKYLYLLVCAEVYAGVRCGDLQNRGAPDAAERRAEIGLVFSPAPRSYCIAAACLR
jgi:hypothetical protein